MKRRVFLRGLAGLVILTLAGCGNATTGGEPTNAPHGLYGIPLSEPTHPLSIPKIKLLTIQDDSKAAKIWTPINLQQSKSIIISLLTGATPSIVHMQNLPVVQFNANVAPSMLRIIGTNGQKLSIYPAYYIAKGGVRQNGNLMYTAKYIQDTIAVRQSGHVIYLKDGKMYNWLKNDRWKANFELSGTDNQQIGNSSQISGTQTATEQYDQILSAVTYSNIEMKKLNDLSQKEGVTVYIPRKMGGPSGFYKPSAPQAADHVVFLSFEDMSFYEASTWSGLIGSSYFTSSNQKPVVQQGGSYTLNHGGHGQWYTIAYSDGARCNLFVVKQGNTLIGIVPNPAKYTIPSLVQAVSQTLQPIS